MTDKKRDQLPGVFPFLRRATYTPPSRSARDAAMASCTSTTGRAGCLRSSPNLSTTSRLAGIVCIPLAADNSVRSGRKSPESGSHAKTYLFPDQVEVTSDGERTWQTVGLRVGRPGPREAGVSND